MALAILANTYNQKASLPQAIVGLSAYHGGLDKKGFQEQHALGLVLHYDTVHNHITRLKEIDDQVIKDYQPKENVIFTADNADKEMKNRAERGGKVNPKITAVNRFVTSPRVVDPDLPKQPTTTASDTPASAYFHDDSDVAKIRAYMASIIVDVALEQQVSLFKDHFTKGALDPFVDPKMAEKTLIHLLPLIFKSENKYDELRVVIDSDLERLGIWSPNPDQSTLYFGDQLTCERLAGLINILDEYQKYHQLNPAVADWHARLAFVQVLFFPLLYWVVTQGLGPQKSCFFVE